MKRKIEIGHLWLDDSLIARVEAHKQHSLDSAKNTEIYSMLLEADFGMWLSSYLEIYLS